MGSYAEALTDLSLIADSRYLPTPIAQAIPGLITDLKRLIATMSVNPEGALPPAIAIDDVPYAIKMSVANVEYVQHVSVLLTGDTPPQPSAWSRSPSGSPEVSKAS